MASQGIKLELRLACLVCLCCSGLCSLLSPCSWVCASFLSLSLSCPLTSISSCSWVLSSILSLSSPSPLSPPALGLCILLPPSSPPCKPISAHFPFIHTFSCSPLQPLSAHFPFIHTSSCSPCSLYLLTFLSFMLAFFHFAYEVFVAHSAPLGVGTISPLLIAGMYVWYVCLSVQGVSELCQFRNAVLPWRTIAGADTESQIRGGPQGATPPCKVNYSGSHPLLLYQTNFLVMWLMDFLHPKVCQVQQ